MPTTLNADYPVVDLALARRLERAEGLANAEFVDAHARAFPETGAQWIEVAGVLAMFDGVDSPCTQAFGLGIFDPVTDAQLEELESFFENRGAKVFHEVCPLVDMSLVEMLNARGYRPMEYSSVLYRPIRTGEESKLAENSSIEARLVKSDEAKLWTHVVREGWHDVAPEIGDFLREFEHIIPHQRNSHKFLAEKSGQPIAAGALHVAEGVALLAGACTIPQHRKQGAQRALLERRFRFAVDHGCDIAMMVAQPGSGSQRNAERQGFRIAYTRTKWCRSTA
jgi:GNAT superfamily N-acetyltransferase